VDNQIKFVIMKLCPLLRWEIGSDYNRAKFAAMQFPKFENPCHIPPQLHYWPQMPQKRCAFSGRQIWRLSYKAAFTLADSSCTTTKPISYQKLCLYCRVSFWHSSAEIMTND